MMRVIPWHIIYCLCCSLGFAAGSIRVLTGKIQAYFGKIGTRKGMAWLRKSV
jgi:hypothetical protein